MTLAVLLRGEPRFFRLFLSCKIHRGEDWSLKLNDSTDRSVEIVLNDTFDKCPLTLRAMDVRMGEGIRTFPLNPEITLGAAYAGTPSEVLYPPLKPEDKAMAFFANAKLSGLAGNIYSHDFVIGVVYSDNAQACNEVAPPAIWAKVQAKAEGSVVPAPNYDMGFADILMIVDANNIVQDASAGALKLIPPETNAQPGEEFRIFSLVRGACCHTYSFAEVNELYVGGDAFKRGELVKGSVYLPWQYFDLAGKALPLERTLILRHTGDGGVVSYELFQIRFPGPEVAKID